MDFAALNAGVIELMRVIFDIAPQSTKPLIKHKRLALSQFELSLIPGEGGYDLEIKLPDHYLDHLENFQSYS